MASSTARFPLRRVLLGVGFLVAFWWWPPDGLSGIACSVLFGPTDTEYAAGYSDWRFRRIHIGMTIDEVRERLGPPLEDYDVTKPDGSRLLGWRYSRDRSGGDYRLRGMHFRDGRVSAVFSEYYVD